MKKNKIIVGVLIFSLILLNLSLAIAAADFPVAGYEVSDKATGIGLGTGYTVVIAGKAVNSTETITKVYLFLEALNENPSHLTFGCYNGTGTTYTKRVNSSLRTTLIGTGIQNHTINIVGCQVGDFIGYYQNQGDMRPSCKLNLGEQGVYYKASDCLNTCTGMTLTTAYREPAIQYWVLPGYSASTLNISSPLPLNDTVRNNPFIYFNITVNSTTNFSCNLSINGTFNLSTYEIISGTFDNNVSFNQTFAEGDWTYKIECNNTADHANTSTFSFTVDTTSPIIHDNFTNSSIWLLTNITGQFNFSDNLALFSYNFSIDGSQIYRTENLSGTNHSYNLSHNITTLSNGEHLLIVSVSDGHTAQSLESVEDWEWSNGLFNDYIKFKWKEPYNKGEVTIQNKVVSLFDNWIASKESDRYSFEFTPSVPTSSYVFEVDSTFPIYIITNPESKYKEWLVLDEHWLDFYNEDQPNQVIKLNQLSPYKVEVTVSNLDTKIGIIKFNSIGDLNTISKHYKFYKTNVTLTYGNPVLELSTQTYTMVVDKPTGIDNTSFAFYWNDSIKNITKTNFPTYDHYTLDLAMPLIATQTQAFTFNWIYNISGSVDTISGNITTTQTVYNLLIDNCTNKSYIRALNLSLVDDSTNGLINGDIDSYNKVWIDDIDSYKEFNLSWDDQNRSGICISPNATNYTIYSQFEYSATGYSSKTYYFTNASLTNHSKNLTFYLTNGSSLVTFTVTNQDDAPIQGVYISILKYDIGTNSYLVSEIIYTDEQGEAVGSIVLNTQFYKFLLTLNNVVVLATDPIKITSTSRNFRVQILDDFFDTYDGAGTITTSLIFTNATKNFAFTFLNPGGTPITSCLKVIERSVTRDLLINNSCLTSSSGTILINVGNETAGKTYIATGTTASSPNFLQESLTISFEDGYKKWGRDGIYATVFLRLSLAMIGIFNPMIAIVLVVVLDILMIILGLYSLSWPIISVYLILAGLAIWRLNQR